MSGLAFYTLYHPATGEIVGGFTAFPSDVGQNVRTGCDVIPGKFEAGTCFVTNGKAAAYSDAERARKLVKPEFPAAWSNESMSWVDTRSSQERIAQQWVKVRAERDALLESTDWVVIKQAEAGGPLPTPWRQYRDALRDITVQPDPFNLVWPTPP